MCTVCNIIMQCSPWLTILYLNVPIKKKNNNEKSNNYLNGLITNDVNSSTTYRLVQIGGSTFMYILHNFDNFFYLLPPSKYICGMNKKGCYKLQCDVFKKHPILYRLEWD